MTLGTAYLAAANYLARNLPENRTPPTRRWHGRYYQMADSCYRAITVETIESDFIKWAARSQAARTNNNGKVEPLGRTFVANSMLAIQAETHVPDSVMPGTWIENRPQVAIGPFVSVRNGILDLGTLPQSSPALLESSPSFFSLGTLPLSFDPTAGCPQWLAFLGQTFPSTDAAIALLQEVFGYCLLPDCRFEKFFFFHGDGNTGKSTVAETLQAMLGEGNVSALTLERFSERFALTSLIGKLANIVFDCSEIDRSAEGTLKALASGEPVPVEDKYGPLSTMRLTAKHIFATNVLPRFHDTTNGIWRRLVLVPFLRVCPEGERDPTLKVKLRTELSGIANWALAGLARLLSQGSFSMFEDGATLSADYRRESNPVEMFLTTECETVPEALVSRSVVYSRYKLWATENSHAIQSSTRFYKQVRAIYPQPATEIRDGRGGDRMLVGFRLREIADLLGRFRALDMARVEEAQP